MAVPLNPLIILQANEMSPESDAVKGSWVSTGPNKKRAEDFHE
jgi:hypothetical protein